MKRQFLFIFSSLGLPVVAYAGLVTTVCAFISSPQLNSQCVQTTSSGSFDDVGVRVCMAGDDAFKAQCIQIIKDAKFDQTAANICTMIAENADKKSCLKAIINKSYDNGEANACFAVLSDSEKVTCLGNRGQISFSWAIGQSAYVPQCGGTVRIDRSSDPDKVVLRIKPAAHAPAPPSPAD